ncbi:MAG: endolytic transglycosylase MltG [Magnetococcales bacterium]|nr:endolytic transglycosylase MltG [Magnetococcales bacterium]NGZ26948.1 endolytic transglycosylase MltG [Magnetococcales bacterium]
MIRRFSWHSFFSTAGILLLGAGLFAWSSWQDFKLYTNPQTTETTIAKGMGMVQVAERLASLGVISSANLFIADYYLNHEGMLKAGEYRFEEGEDARRILQKLLKGEIIQYKLIIPEGFSLKEIAREMSNQGIEGAGQLLSDHAMVNQMGVAATTLEGWLFPDTYFFRKGTNAQEIIRRMVDRSRNILTREWESRQEGITLTPYQGLILASIVEKETGIEGERKRVAAVFHNRLKRKMRLQSDPTVIYGISDFNGDITRKDLTTPTPFNTYTMEGLPPSPICNPGQASIHATFHPEKSDELYFVASGDGGHVFAKTLAEHQKNVSRYLKRQRQD